MGAMVGGSNAVACGIAVLTGQDVGGIGQHYGFRLTVFVVEVPNLTESRLSIGIEKGGVVVLDAAVKDSHNDPLSSIGLWQRTVSVSHRVYISGYSCFIQTEVEATLFLHAKHTRVGSGFHNLADGDVHHGNVA